MVEKFVQEVSEMVLVRVVELLEDMSKELYNLVKASIEKE